MDEKIGWRGLLVAWAFVPSLMILRGWVLSAMWAWFIVPLFAAPALGIAQAIGVSCVVSFLTYQHKTGEKTVRQVIDMMFHAALWPFFALATAWGVTLFL